MTAKGYVSPVRFCPSCGSSMEEEQSIVIEYWEADKSVCFSWCHVCKWRGEIAEIVRVTTTQIEEND